MLLEKSLPGILVIPLSLALCALVIREDNSRPRPPASARLYYKSGKPYQRMEHNVNSGPPIFRSINCDPNYVSCNFSSTAFRTLSNWSTSSYDAGDLSTPAANDPSTYLWSFDVSSYQDMSTDDNDDATGLSTAEALEALHSFFVAHGHFPHTIRVDTDGVAGNDIFIRDVIAIGQPH